MNSLQRFLPNSFWPISGKIITIDNKIVVPKSELHKVLCQCHSSTADRGRDKINNYVKGIYSEVLQQVVSLFASLCRLHAQQTSSTETTCRISNVHKKEEGPVKARVILAANNQSSVASGSSSGSKKSGLSDIAYDILAQQNHVMREFVSQQERNLLPRRPTCVE
ncbi:hypothetical protein P5673_011812 [Acropora cervicornis]|uniref:Uncharacterized protein n=1 Tax=Acropora cervicornis TaxID=6130 RepID=A0AAD9QNU4_ACRCE|nr:hypothetical protein P5673_011812 [Acropora cervicornis]